MPEDLAAKASTAYLRLSLDFPGLR